MTRDQQGHPGRAVAGRLGRAVNGRLASRGLTPYDVQEGAVHAGKNVYRIVAGATAQPRLGTLLAICRTTQTDPTTLLEMAGLWPPDSAFGVRGSAFGETVDVEATATAQDQTPNAKRQTPRREADALDHALLTAQERLEALPPEHKRWALAVVRALVAGAPSRPGD